jgi:large subunit ribosomal protein L9
MCETPAGADAGNQTRPEYCLIALLIRCYPKLTIFDTQEAFVRVILLQDQEGLGNAGDQLDVKNGYARNFLIPRGIALKADKNSIKQLQEMDRLQNRKKDKALRQSRELAEKLQSLSLTIPVQVGEEDRVFGAVTSQEIAQQLQDKGYDIDKRQIILEQPIKALGVFEIPLKLHSEITTTVKLWVIKA